MPSIEYGQPGQRGPHRLPAGSTVDVYIWAPAARLKAVKSGEQAQSEELIDFDERLSLVVEHTSATTGGVQIQAFKYIGPHEIRTHNFRLVNASAEVQFLGPLSSVLLKATSLGTGVEMENVTVLGIGRTEGR